MEQLTQEDLEEWGQHPITRRVIAALEATAAERKETIVSALFATGEADKWFLAKVVAYQDVIFALKEARAEEINDWTVGFEASSEDG